ncbi:aspartate kinase [Vibrio agarivorans]|nr:aspartate kinase [Vibrio agarivorans]
MPGIGIAVPPITCLGSAPLLHKAFSLNGFIGIMSTYILEKMI